MHIQWMELNASQNKSPTIAWLAVRPVCWSDTMSTWFLSCSNKRIGRSHSLPFCFSFLFFSLFLFVSLSSPPSSSHWIVDSALRQFLLSWHLLDVRCNWVKSQKKTSVTSTTCERHGIWYEMIRTISPVQATSYVKVRYVPKHYVLSNNYRNTVRNNDGISLHVCNCPWDQQTTTTTYILLFVPPTVAIAYLPNRTIIHI